MFEKEYSFFGLLLTCTTVQVSSAFKQETDTYDHIRPIAQKKLWRYHRIDTTGQFGFPDILLLKQTNFWLLECKILRKKKLKYRLMKS